MIYLDNNATTQPAGPVVEAVQSALVEHWANPFSVHRFGQRTRAAVDLAREQLAKLINARPRELIFTSGATEANNLALRGIAALRKDRKLIASPATEHSAVREVVGDLENQGYALHELAIDDQGVVRLDALDALLEARADELALVSVHWANNETGVIQPIAEIAERCRAAKVPIHCDATQAVGKLPVDVQDVPIDALSLSAHKFHGPKGVGALFLRATRRAMPQIFGGPQERNRRGGTENVPGIVGMGMAAELAETFVQSDQPEHLRAMRDRLEKQLCQAIPAAVVHSHKAPRLWNTINIGFAQLEAEAMVVGLSERDVCISAGAACSSGSLEPSPVLLAMNIPEPIAHGSIRISLSRFTTEREIDEAAPRIIATVEKLQQSMIV